MDTHRFTLEYIGIPLETKQGNLRNTKIHRITIIHQAEMSYRTNEQLCVTAVAIVNKLFALILTRISIRNWVERAG
jgi:hypothetical protein